MIVCIRICTPVPTVLFALEMPVFLPNGAFIPPWLLPSNHRYRTVSTKNKNRIVASGTINPAQSPVGRPPTFSTCVYPLPSNSTHDNFPPGVMVESTANKFRAIIVGAGPVGLYLAHAFSKAKIDYVVLEQSDSVVRYQGAGVLLYSQTLRLLDQIGLYDEAGNDYIIVHNQTDLLTSNGRVIKSTPLWSVLGER